MLPSYDTKGSFLSKYFHDIRFTADFRLNIPDCNFFPTIFRENMCETGENAPGSLENWLILRKKFKYFRGKYNESGDFRGHFGET